MERQIQTDVQGQAGGKSEVARWMDVSSLGPKHRMIAGKLSQSISDTNLPGVFALLQLDGLKCTK